MGLTREEQQAARRKALLLLEHMDRTEKGLSDRLRQAGFCTEAVEDAVAYVSYFGYVDDSRYAENYIAYRIQSKSRHKILQELLQKGVDKETAQTAWEQVSNPDKGRKAVADQMERAAETVYGPFSRCMFTGIIPCNCIRSIHIRSCSKICSICTINGC